MENSLASKPGSSFAFAKRPVSLLIRFMKVKIPVENNFKGRNRDVDQELDQERRSNKENRGDAPIFADEQV